ncbi:MAG: FAD-binding oxidoreductase, partial [Pseudomonadota bacterium]
MAVAVAQDRSLTFFGQGRSYGDVALNDGGTVLRTHDLNRFIEADWTTGKIRAEAGMTTDQLLRASVPRGWFVPVTPGTKFVSLGGAVANDVHGKNHHAVGSFGAHVSALGLVRSDGEMMTLSREQNADLFGLTISGLGLTGFISWVELQLIPITSPFMAVENVKMKNLDAFYELSAASENWPYCVAWVDCFATGASLGRGVFTRARHSAQVQALETHSTDAKLTWRTESPSWMLNKASISAFNAAYRNRPGASLCGDQHYGGFFYPLDGISQWNRMYGRQGFFQHQCVVPKDVAPNAIRELLDRIAEAGQGSFLAVLKQHAQETSPGRNSFCMDGTSLALDFANKGASTLALLSDLDRIVLKYEGRMYPAKDG